MDMMDFSFPATPTTTATATATKTTTPEPPPPAVVVVVASPLPSASPAACRHQLPFSRFVATASSSSSPPPSPVTTRSRRRAAPTLTAMAAQQAGSPPPPGAGPGGDDDAASAAAAVAEVEDRMDLLWEDFNEELARGGEGGSCRAAAGLQQRARELWRPSEPESSSDAESEPAAARGCAPVLRPSSRARAVRHCRRRAGTWVLLMRIFRRLFVIEKTAVAARRRHHAAVATTAS